jgi:hypothetical protein
VRISLILFGSFYYEVQAFLGIFFIDFDAGFKFYEWFFVDKISFFIEYTKLQLNEFGYFGICWDSLSWNPNFKMISKSLKTCSYLIVPTLRRHYSALVQVKNILYALMWSLTIKVLNTQDISKIFHFTSGIWLILWKISKIKMDKSLYNSFTCTSTSEKILRMNLVCTSKF